MILSYTYQQTVLQQSGKLTVKCKVYCMKLIQNYHNEHTKIEFGMLIVVILYEFHTSHFAVSCISLFDQLQRLDVN